MYNHIYEFTCPNCNGKTNTESEIEVSEMMCPCGSPSKMTSYKTMSEVLVEQLPVSE